MARLHRGPLQVLITEIVSGDLLTGDALPRETDLAERFEVSRGTAREVIRGLEERRLIAVKHGRGAAVTDPEAWDRLDRDVLAALLAGPQCSEVLREFLESRRVLEIEAAGLAAVRADRDGVALLESAYARMVEAAAQARRHRSNEADFHEADVDFHRVLVHLTANQVLVTLVGRIHGAMIEARYPTARPLLRESRTLPEHDRILVAVRHGDPDEARLAMATHLDSVEEFLLEAMPLGETERAINRV